jgi:cyclohexanone monooxygenase
MRRQGLERVEAEPAAEADWLARCEAIAAASFYPEADSWYMGANVPGKPRGLLPYAGGVGVYRGICNEIARNGYEGFKLA